MGLSTKEWWEVLAAYLGERAPTQMCRSPAGVLLQLPPTATLVACVEFAKATVFSGNGTHAGVVVDGLRKAQLGTEGSRTSFIQSLTIVVCGMPGQSNAQEQEQALTEWVAPQSLQVVLPIPVTSWRSLDWGCCWREVASGAREALGACALQETPKPPGQATLRPYCIDWSGYLILRGMCEGLLARPEMDTFFAQRVVYLNFRVFGLPWWLDAKCERAILDVLGGGEGMD